MPILHAEACKLGAVRGYPEIPRVVERRVDGDWADERFVEHTVGGLMCCRFAQCLRRGLNV
jgi:hypothetical protein